MVLSDVSRSVDGVERALTELDLAVMAPIAFMTAGGMVLAQEAVDLVFPKFNLSTNPTTVKDLSLAALFKMGVAIALAFVGSMVGDSVGSRALPGLFVVLAIGVLGHSGADIIDLVQKLMNGDSTTTAQTRSRSRQTRSRNRSRSRRPARASQSRSPSASRSTATTRASSPDAKKLENQTWG